MQLAPPEHRAPFGPPFPLVTVDGEVCDEDNARIPVGASVVSYGLGTFEGIRAFWNSGSDQLYLLDAVDHYDRLGRSSRILGLDFPFKTEDLLAWTKELFRADDVRSNAYVRSIYYFAGEVLTDRMRNITPRLVIACHPVPGDYINPSGVRCMVSSWRRQPDASTPNRAKVIGSYVGLAIAKTDAVRHGFDEALLLTHDGFVEEPTTSNIMVKTDGRWHTAAGTDDILLGITRARVKQLIAEITGEAVIERRIHRSELYTAGRGAPVRHGRNGGAGRVRRQPRCRRRAPRATHHAPARNPASNRAA